MDKAPDISKGLQHYLEDIGAYRLGPQAIAEAKKRYRTYYNKIAKQQSRKRKSEFSIVMEHDDAERIKSEALRHCLTPAEYIAKAAVAYDGKTYVTPDTDMVVTLLQQLSQSASDMRFMASKKQLDQTELQALIRRVQAMEDQVLEALTLPVPEDVHIANYLAEHPELLNRYRP